MPAPYRERTSCWAALRRWILWIGYAFLAASGWVRMVSSIESWYWLNFAGVRPGPLYLAITGGVWGGVGLVALVWMALRRPWYRLVGMAAALVFALTYWIDRLLFVRPGGSNAPFAVLVTLLGLAYAVLMLRPLEELKEIHL
jgi:hypothetical protein